MKTILISGGSGGLGRSIIYDYTDEYRFINLDIQEPHNPCKNELFIKTDLSQPDEIYASLRSIDPQLEIYSFIHCAGVSGTYQSVLDIPVSEWYSIIEINLNSAYHITRFILPILRKFKNGRMIYIGSIYSVKGSKFSSPYTASKHALLGMIKSLAEEWGEFGITFNMVSPGFVDTEIGIKEDKVHGHLKEVIEQIPVKRISQPFEISRMVGFLLDEKSSYITGANLMIDGGISSI
jgi:3-oxoacyl-[acyl-carrier protein] reductase